MSLLPRYRIPGPVLAGITDRVHPLRVPDRTSALSYRTFIKYGWW
jgi:hypothetical protein